jgi:hypothetical protein
MRSLADYVPSPSPERQSSIGGTSPLLATRDAMTRLEAGLQKEKAKAAREQKAEQRQFGQSLGRNASECQDSETKSLPPTPQVN